MQKESPVAIIRDTLRTKGVVGLYSGCTALMVGNAAKAGVRFVSYDHFKGMLADPQVCFFRSCFHAGTRSAYGGFCEGKVSAPRNIDSSWNVG